MAGFICIDEKFHVFDGQVFLLPGSGLIYSFTRFVILIDRLNRDIRYGEAKRELVLFVLRVFYSHIHVLNLYRDVS